jgi:hypothetical protein
MVSDFVVSMVGWWVYYELKSIWKEMVLALYTYCPSSFVERLRNAMGILRRIGCVPPALGTHPLEYTIPAFV